MKQNSIVSEAYLEPSRTSTTELFCENTPFFINNSCLTLSPKIVSAFLKNRPKKLFSNCLVDGLNFYCLNIQIF